MTIVKSSLRNWIILLTALVSICAFVIDDVQLKVLLSRFDRLKQNYPQEKVHLHFDKPYYSVGDTVYFKAYIVNAEKNLPSGISNILNVDLIGIDSTIKKSMRLPVWEGVAWSSFLLENSLQEGRYHIRAYTNWMRNFDSAYFFDKEITIGDALNSNLTATLSVTIDSTNKQQKNVATITYRSLNGMLAKGVEVSYTVMSKSKEILKGKSVTDSSGKINIVFHAGNIHGQIITNIKTGNKTGVTKVLNFETALPKPSIQFFPEGGQLLYSDYSRVAFKAIGANGFGINVSGDVVDNTGRIITHFQSGFAGIGSFAFTPFTGNEYFAIVKYSDGDTTKIALPKPQEIGYGLYIDNSDDEKINIKISAHQATALNDVLLVAQTQNVITYIAKTTLSNAGFVGSISKNKFSTGIAQFTLFNANMQPVAERLAFIDRHDQLQVKLSADKKVYSKREKIKLTLEALDEDNDPITGSFSVAVTNANKVVLDEQQEQTILSDLLLSSDIRGYIENPNYYFTDVNPVKIRALDDLLLTQGWRRFIWTDLMADKFPSLQYKPEKSLVISGKVLSKNGKPLNDAKVSILSRKGSGFTMDTVTNADGVFRFEDLELEGDSIDLVVRAESSIGSKEVRIEMDKNLPPQFALKEGTPSGEKMERAVLTYIKSSNDRFNEMKRLGLLQSSNGALKEVVIKTKTLSKIEEAVASSANLNGPGRADQVLTYIDLDNCSTLAVCLPGKMRGVYLRKTFDQVTKTWATLAFSSIGMGTPMIIIMDGMPMDPFHGGATLDNIAPGDIQSIEVLKSGGYLSVYGTRAAGGALIITTKKGGIDYNANIASQKRVQDLNGMLFTSSKVYFTGREFYSPDHSNPSINTTLPDVRSTVFWKPGITTDEYGKATVEFYNTDVPGDYKVIVEGLSETGKLARKVYYYKVL